jgi:hypothetical protein
MWRLEEERLTVTLCADGEDNDMRTCSSDVQDLYILICSFNPLNAELNPICNLLILLGDLTFVGGVS